MTWLRSFPRKIIGWVGKRALQDILWERNRKLFPLAFLMPGQDLQTISLSSLQGLSAIKDIMTEKACFGERNGRRKNEHRHYQQLSGHVEMCQSLSRAGEIKKEWKKPLHKGDKKNSNWRISLLRRMLDIPSLLQMMLQIVLDESTK